MKNKQLALRGGLTRGEGLLEEFLAKKRADFALDLIPRSHFKGKVLDIGCGVYPYFLITSGFSKKYGLDYSTDRSKIKDKSLIIKKLDVEKSGLPFKSGYFDSIVMLAVFEHININKLNFVLSEVKRVLKKSGIFIITTPSPWSDRVLHLMSRFGLISKEEIHDHKHNMSHKNIEALLIEAGFDQKNIKKGFFELSFNMWFKVTK